MKIVADQQIPAVSQYFATAGELILKPGRDISHADLVDADVLLVRSVTRVDNALLNNTAVRFVGSVATGMDHLDTQWLTQVGIKWYAARGFNAIAVTEYVIAVVAALQKSQLLPLHSLRVGVIGVGQIGTLVAEKLRLLGAEVILCDPLRARLEKDFKSVAITDFKELDLVTVHTPLTREGEFPTFHLLDRNFLQRQKNGCALINTARGAVLDFQALQEWGNGLSWCLDVWENEPLIEANVLQRAKIATPHIAGYSMQSKLSGVQMLYDAVCQQKIIKDMAIHVEPPAKKVLTFGGKKVDWRDVVLRIFDPRELTKVMRKALQENNTGQMFDDLRKHFNGRYEFAGVELHEVKLADEDREILQMLGVAISNLRIFER